MKDCVFCKIISGEFDSIKVYEDDKYLAFNDIHPRAENHILIIPKKHIISFLETDFKDQELVKGLMDVAWEIAQKKGFKGCKLLFNSGKDHEQEVNHLHLHLMNGLKK